MSKPKNMTISQKEYARKWDKAFGKSGCAYPLCENYSEGSTEYCCAGCSIDHYDYVRLKKEKNLKISPKRIKEAINKSRRGFTLDKTI